MGPSHFAIKTYLENIGKKHREYKKKGRVPSNILKLENDIKSGKT